MARTILLLPFALPLTEQFSKPQKSSILSIKEKNVEIVILDSALKHDMTEDRILSCLFNIKGDKLLDD